MVVIVEGGGAKRFSAKRRVSNLQTVITNDVEWEKFILTPGILDIYSEWCGPCVAMVPTLRKLKKELGGDILRYAIAKSDTITFHKQFRDKSQPTWMFLSGGQIINLVFGANAPALSRQIRNEVKREIARQAMKEEEKLMSDSKKYETNDDENELFTSD